MQKQYDAIVVGGGHNGLICAGYLGRAGQRVLVLERRAILGGPAGTFEFLPGYKASFANSPGSFEPRITDDLRLATFGLSFIPTDVMVMHPFPSGWFVGWRNRERLIAQLDAFAPGEAQRYFDFLASLEELARHLGASVHEPSPDITTMARRVPASLTRLFEAVFFGSLTELLDTSLKSVEAKALMGLVAINAVNAPPSTPGTAMGLMMRPISLASTPAVSADDPRSMPLRGSTGLPVGGMGALIDAIVASCRDAGVVVRASSPVERILVEDGRAAGVVLAGGEAIRAGTVVSAINPTTLVSRLLPEDSVPERLRREMAAVPMHGSAFKIVLALDGLPTYAGLPPDLSPEMARRVQIRVAPSLDYIERAVADGLAGRPSAGPIMWGLIPTATSEGLAPKGRHLMSINAWHAPYRLADGRWDPARREAFGKRCIEVLGQSMPDLATRIVDARFMDPVEIEAELGLVESNITHGEMLPKQLFGARPHPDLNNYRGPLPGLYLSGAGVWPGGYITGLPGRNTSAAVLADLASGRPKY